MVGLLLVVAQIGPALSFGDTTGIYPEQAYRFGVLPEQAKAEWEQAKRQAEAMRWSVWANNPPATFLAWRDETAWRACCWCKLVICFDHKACRDLAWHTYPGSREPYEGEMQRERIQALAALRAMIGREAYDAGRMPAATPNYKVPK